jgi:hypothetical protein
MDFEQIEDGCKELLTGYGTHGLSYYLAALIPKENRHFVIKTLTRKIDDLQQVLERVQGKIDDRKVTITFLGPNYLKPYANGVGCCLASYIPEENKPGIINELTKEIGDLEQQIKGIQSKIDEHKAISTFLNPSDLLKCYTK